MNELGGLYGRRKCEHRCFARCSCGVMNRPSAKSRVKRLAGKPGTTPARACPRGRWARMRPTGSLRGTQLRCEKRLTLAKRCDVGDAAAENRARYKGVNGAQPRSFFFRHSSAREPRAEKKQRVRPWGRKTQGGSINECATAHTFMLRLEWSRRA